MEKSTIKERIEEFMKEEFLIEFTDDLTEDDDLFKAGVIDSYRYIKLIRFLEEEFKIKFSEEEILSNVFVTLSSILGCIASKYRPRVKKLG